MGALAHSIPLLLATRVLEGMGCLMAAVSAPSLITRLAQPGDLRLALSIWRTWLPAGSATIMQGAQLGQVLGPPILALIVSTLGGWQAAPMLLIPAAGLGILLSFGLAALERN